MPELDTDEGLGPLGSVKVSTDGDGWLGLLQGPELGPSCQSESRSRRHPTLGQPGAVFG